MPAKEQMESVATVNYLEEKPNQHGNVGFIRGNTRSTHYSLCVHVKVYIEDRIGDGKQKDSSISMEEKVADTTSNLSK